MHDWTETAGAPEHTDTVCAFNTELFALIFGLAPFTQGPPGGKSRVEPAFKTAKFCRKFNYPLKWNHQKQIKSALCWVQMCASTELIRGSGELHTPRWRKLLYPIVCVASLKTVTLTSTTPIWLCELIMIIVTIANLSGDSLFTFNKTFLYVFIEVNRW